MLSNNPLPSAANPQVLHHAAESDVLRFIGTLALCLMLLFSVDQSFNRVPAPTLSLPNTDTLPAVPAPTTGPPPTVAASPRAVPDVPPRPQRLVTGVADMVPPQLPALEEAISMPPEQGSPDTEEGPATRDAGADPALFFASDAAFLTLLAQRRIAVYLARGTTWVQVTLQREIETAVTPPALYRLRPKTVPELLRRRVTPTDPNMTVEWGVRLTEELDTEVQALLAHASGVDIVIEGSGRARSQPRERQLDARETGALDQ